jgi:hypothetical protein
MVGYPNFGRGMVIMINANDDTGAVKDIAGAIAKKYLRLAGGEPADQ